MKVYGVRKGSKNFWWFVHNVIAHPMSEFLYLARFKKAAEWVHDQTIPIHSNNGRG